LGRRLSLAALWAALDAWKIDGEKPQGTSSLGVGRYVLCFCLFALALLSKTVTGSLPVVVLLLLWWKNGRVTAWQAATTLPFFVMGAAMGSLTAWMEKHVVGATGAEWNLTELQRLLIACKAIWFYLGKLLWPHPLIFVYPRWLVSIRNWESWLYPLAIVALIFLLRKNRAGLAAFLFFAVSLAPALGLVDVYPMRYTFVADHYQYLASIGPLALIAAWIRRPMIGVPIVLLLGLLTFRQSFVYADDVSLWRDVVAKDNRSVIGHANLASALLDRGQIDAAADEAQRALEVGGNLVEAQIEPGVIAEARGDFQMAAQIYRDAAVRWPQSPLPYWHLGLVEPHYLPVASRLHTLGAEAIQSRRHMADVSFRNQGITFTVYSDSSGVEKSSPSIWCRASCPPTNGTIERGLVQRITALNLFCQDIYHQQRILARRSSRRN
jgi:tetratricopeptide (TPR) repeat protein